MLTDRILSLQAAIGAGVLRAFHLALIAGVIASLNQVEVNASFVGHLVAEDTGQPLAGCVSIMDEDGNWIGIEGEHDQVQYLQKKWFYVDGSFEIEGDDFAGWTVEIRRGLETLPLKVTLGSANERVFRLQRWTHMADQGYMSGDTHVHYLKLEQCLLHMRAEDLDVLNLLTSDFTSDVEKFTGELDPMSTSDHWIYVGQEFRDWQQGHINLLRLREIVEPLEPFGGSFRDQSNRHLMVSPAAVEARNQQAAVTWAHFGDIPGTESPIAIALGLIDAVDLISQGDPMRTAYHWPPWKMDQPDHLPVLPPLPAIDMYYQYLNAGFQLPLAAGTDKMSDRIPVGSSRLYVKTDGDRSYDAWIEGLKAGNGFITNGPMLSFSVEEHQAGEVVDFIGSTTVSVQSKARSIYPFSRLQIVVNGEVALTSSMPRRSEEGIYEAQLETTITLAESSWIAARVAETPRPGIRGIMPRGMTMFSHSNPVYFTKEGSKIRRQSAIDYLQLYLRYTKHWLTNSAKFETEEQRDDALGLLNRAVDVYDAL